MATTIQLNFCDSALSDSGWTTVRGGDSTGTKVASGSVVDSAGSTVTGVSVSVADAWDVVTDVGGNTGTDGGYPSNVKVSFWRLDGDGSTGNVIISGLGAGTATVKCYGNRDSASDRITDVVVTGASGSTSSGSYNARYDDPTTANREFQSSSVTLGASDTLTIACTCRAGLSGFAHLNGATIVFTPSASPATLSSATPSGTIGTQTTANIGATTNQTTGTLYVVRATSNVFSGVIAQQVKEGKNASGSTSGVTATSGSISTTTPTVAQSSLTAGTLYYYAVAQENANGLSNAPTGSFTTASATKTVTLTIVDAAGANIANTALDWFVKQGSSITDSGTTTSASGVLTVNTPNAAAGSAEIFYSNAANTLSGRRVVTVV